MKRFPYKLLVVISPLILALLVWHYGVNILYYDEWQIFGTDAILSSSDSLSWSHVFLQHNESRKFFPRLISAVFANFTSWNSFYGMITSVMLACLISFNIYHLSKITLNTSWRKRITLLAIANLLIFNPLQWENWLWGLQCITFVPIAAITSALALIFSQNYLFIKFLISLLVAIFATFSFANGLITWIVIFPALAFIARTNKKSFIAVISGWFFFAALTFAAYFNNYQSPANHSGFFDFLTQPLRGLLYFLAFIGSPLGINDLVSSQIVGLCLLFLLALICGYLFKVNHNKKLLFQVYPWLCIVSYSLGCAILTTTGRLSLGIESAISSRYITFSTYGIVSIVYLLAILTEDLKPNLNIPDSNLLKTLQQISTLSLVGLILIFPANFVAGVKAMKVNHSNKLYAKACVNLIYVVRNEACLEQYLFPNPKFLAAKAMKLDHLGLIRPPLTLSETMQGMTSPNVFEQIKYGQFDTLITSENNTYTVSGWSVLPQYRSAAHAVILAYRTKEDKDYPFALVQPHLPRPDVAVEEEVSGYKYAGWSRAFPQDLIPNDAVGISSWSYDSNIARAYENQIIHQVNPTK